MFNGFPARPVRDDFGPDPSNQYPIRDPNKELDAETTRRLMFHQLSGLGQMNDLAEIIFDGATQVISYRAEAWNPKREAGGLYLPPGIVRNSVGVYTVTYAAQYPDHKSTTIPTMFRAGRCEVLTNDSTPLTTRVTPGTPAGPIVVVRTWKLVATVWTATDGLFDLVLR